MSVLHSARGVNLSLLLWGGLAGLLVGCFAGEAKLDPVSNQGGDANLGGGGPTDSAGSTTSSGIGPVEPYAVIGTNPSHGPFAGGQRVIVLGNGFEEETSLWFGEALVTDRVVIDPTRMQVVVPAGAPGAVDITAQVAEDESTRRTLAGGYSYDALYVAPTSGPLSGGNQVTIFGKSTQWTESSRAYIDNVECAETAFVSEEELLCMVPKGTQGAKSVRVTTDSTSEVVLDGYTYENSTDGFKGGLSGGTLSGTLNVLAFNNFTGDAVPATVIVGDDLETALMKDTDSDGLARFENEELTSPVTVTVIAYCHSPFTYVHVPVDTVTIYLDPILTPACGELADPPGVGGKSTRTGVVSGEIVFPIVNEFDKGPFLVPTPIGAEEIVAYLFQTTSNPMGSFSLPQAGAAIRPDAEGTIGYGFSISSTPGNKAYYVLAGLEDRTAFPPRFTAYSAGLVRGIPVVADETTEEVFVDMKPLDLALTVQPNPPPAGSSGPDRLYSTVAVRVGSEGYVLLPAGQKAPLLPLTSDLQFVGLPLLTGAWAGSTYSVSSRAVTGETYATPMSVVGAVQTNTTAFPVTVGGFVGLPTLVSPALNESWDGENIVVSFGPGEPVDLTVLDVQSDDGLVHWTIAAPGGSQTIELPNLTDLGSLGLPSGPVTFGVLGGRFDTFDYREVKLRQLRSQGMNAYSADFSGAFLP